MSYDILFQVRVHGTDLYVPAWHSANVTWNVRDIIVEFTGLDWNNEANNGLCTDVIPKIREGRRKIDKTIKDTMAQNRHIVWDNSKALINSSLKFWTIGENLVFVTRILSRTSHSG